MDATAWDLPLIAPADARKLQANTQKQLIIYLVIDFLRRADASMAGSISLPAGYSYIIK
jgi:hypothetical protein